MVEQNIKIMTAADQLFYLYGYPPFLKILDYYEKNEYFRQNQHEIELFGDHFICEPNGGNSPKWSFNIID